MIGLLRMYYVLCMYVFIYVFGRVFMVCMYVSMYVRMYAHTCFGMLVNVCLCYVCMHLVYMINLCINTFISKILPKRSHK